MLKNTLIVEKNQKNEIWVDISGFHCAQQMLHGYGLLLRASARSVHYPASNENISMQSLIGHICHESACLCHRLSPKKKNFSISTEKKGNTTTVVFSTYLRKKSLPRQITSQIQTHSDLPFTFLRMIFCRCQCFWLAKNSTPHKTPEHM